MIHKTLFPRIPVQLIIALVAMLLFALPSVQTNELMQGTVSGKMFVFLYAMLIIGALFMLKFMNKPQDRISFSKIDGLLFVWATYILLNGWLQQMPVSNRLLEFAGLIVLYIALRQIEPTKYGILLIAMMFGGVIQAVYGNLQLWGYFPSHHSLFRITGSFFNPGPFAGYLASVFPAVLGIFLFKIYPLAVMDEKLNFVLNWAGRRLSSRFKPVQWPVTGWIAAISLMVMLLVIFPSQSRAAWLAVAVSSVVLLMIRYDVMWRLRKRSHLWRGAMLLLLCIILGASVFGLFHLKADSANGRVLIWKITGAMISERPVTGTGFDRFKSLYMTGQAEYFEQNPDSQEAMVAGDVNYAFNDFLQHTAENGLTGLVLMLSVLIAAMRVTAKAKPFNDLAWIAKTGIVGIAFFAFFSYPSQILPIKMSLTLYLACLSSLSEKRTWKNRAIKSIPIKWALTVCMTLCVFFCYKYLTIQHKAWKDWNQAYRLYTMNNYTDCLHYYEKAWPALKTEGDYLTNYGKALSMAGEHGSAITVLQQATSYYPNIVVYTALGDSYKALEQYVEAEQAYWTAWYMNPSRFLPKYFLAKLYDETGQTEKAAATAYELLHKEVKVRSTAIDEIRKEMEKIYQKNRQ